MTTVGSFTLEQVESGFAAASLDAQLAYERALIDEQAGWRLYGVGQGKSPGDEQWREWNKDARARARGETLQKERA